jgi:hypothetical protein
MRVQDKLAPRDREQLTPFSMWFVGEWGNLNLRRNGAENRIELSGPCCGSRLERGRLLVGVEQSRHVQFNLSKGMNRWPLQKMEISTAASYETRVNPRTMVFDPFSFDNPRLGPDSARSLCILRD